MIELVVSSSLALGSVIFRRFLDSFFVRVPPSVPRQSVLSNAAIFLSGALYYLYIHLKNGTMVRVGTKHKLDLPKLTICHNGCIQKRRPRSTGWFLRNARSCRSKCTDAIYRVAKQSIDSIVQHKPIKKFTESMQSNNVDKTTNPMEHFNSNHCDTNFIKKPVPCNVIYNNTAFEADSLMCNLVEEKKASIPSNVDKSKQENTVKSRIIKSIKVKHKSRPKNPHRKKKNRAKSLKITRKTRSGKVYFIKI